jgi:hypothetical protein
MKKPAIRLSIPVNGGASARPMGAITQARRSAPPRHVVPRDTVKMSHSHLIIVSDNNSINTPSQLLLDQRPPPLQTGANCFFLGGT